MVLHDDSDMEWHGGWLGAAVVFAVGLAVALLMLSIDWTARDEDGAFGAHSANTRPLVMLPLPLR